MALSPMARQVADAKAWQRAVQEAQQEAAVSRERLDALECSHESALEASEAQRQECVRVSSAFTHDTAFTHGP